MTKGIFEKLIALKEENLISFHMPGHKNSEIFKKYFKDNNLIDLDTTEIPGADNLHDPQEAIKASQERLSKIYQTKKSYFLVNGSTSGILSMLMATTSYGDKILVNRNCHKSVHNGIYLNNLKPIYISPEVDDASGVILGINYDKMDEILKANQELKVVLLNYPTYDGITFDIDKVKEIVEKRNCILLIDEAHGSHFILNDELPSSSINKGADLVVQSAHKNLSGLTQSAFLHVNSDKINLERLEKHLKIFQSTSPSYILMSSLDITLEIIEKEGRALSDQLIKNLKQFRQKMEQLNYKVIGKELMNKNYVQAIDLSKIVISPLTIGLTGRELSKILREKYQIQTEYSTYNYTLLLSSIFNKASDFEKLYDALEAIERHHQKDALLSKKPLILNETIVTYSPRAIDQMENEELSIDEAVNRVASESIIPYPPGIPLISPGELVTAEAVDKIRQIQNRIKVVK